MRSISIGSLRWVLSVALCVPVACEDSGGGDDAANDDAGDDGSNCEATPEATFAAADESACAAAASDYVPGSDGDPYGACATDDGKYHLIDTTPSSIARVQAYVDVVDILAGSPTSDDFTEARTVYAIEEGLESRVLRREDLHYPAIPESDFDPDFEDDKQCSSPLNVERHPDRCAGPAKIAPLINEGFVGGIEGTGTAKVHAARIEAAGMWFLFLSTFKEANTCITKAKDCDSSWAYYTGGFDRAGGLAFSAETSALSELAHNRVFDGISAVRCWRELYPIETYPTRDDLDEAGEALLSDALAQLDAALWYALARVVRDHIETQDTVCGSDAEANWEYLKILGPVLDREAAGRDAGAAGTLTSLWAMSEPTAADLEAGVDAIDTLFSCP